MKFKTTKKAINNGYGYKICIPFADLQHLLNYTEPCAYTCGTMGWNADIYHIDLNVAIVTGYRPFGNIKPDSKMVRDYDEIAKEIISDWDISVPRKKEKLNILINQFVEECLEKYR